MSNPKVKGLLKGLRYISQIFDEKEEDEIQIGFPTDVKHVAHIGWDGPSANTPTWMQEFKTSENPSEAAATVPPVEIKDKKSKAFWSRNHNKDIPTPRSRQDSMESESSQPNSPSRRSSDASKQSRRNRSSDPSKDSGTSRHRRHRHSKKDAESQSSDHTATAPKTTRRRKAKTSSGDGSARSSSMTDTSLPELGSGL